jgi:hypothetical protein
LAELQRQAMETNGNFLWSEPTAWDCAILPGLNYKPDNIWCFDHSGNPFFSAGTCKINTGDLGYVLQLEVLESGIQQHSAARNVSDVQREKEIRQVFHGIPMGVVYIVMAHDKHPGAKSKDVFFTKVDKEYQVLPGREDAWQALIGRLVVTLNEMYDNSHDKTVYL